MRHAAYAASWKKLEPIWDWVIRAGRLGMMRPVLEAILSGFTAGGGASAARGTEWAAPSDGSVAPSSG